MPAGQAHACSYPSERENRTAGETLYVAELAGRIVRIPVLPDLGEPEEIAVGLPRLEAITVSIDRI